MKFLFILMWSVAMKLTTENFFSHLIFYPLEADTYNDRAVSLVASVALFVFSAGICHVVCGIRNCFTSKASSQSDELTEVVSGVGLSALGIIKNHSFWSGITPGNIHENLLLCHREFRDENNWIDHLFTINASVDSSGFYEKNCTSYSCLFHKKNNGNRSWTCVSFEVEGDKFKWREEGTPDTYHYFASLGDLLPHLMNARFYHSQYFQADHYILINKDVESLVYENKPSFMNSVFRNWC